MEPQVTRVLIPDANNRAALAAVRSLGRRGCEVIAGKTGHRNLGSVSRFARFSLMHPDPAQDPEGFFVAVRDGVRRLGIGVVMPAADVAANVLIERRDELPDGVRLVAPSAQSLQIAHDKVRLAAFARELSVPVPEGFEGEGDVASDPRTTALGYPLILKPRWSRFLRDGRWANASVVEARDADHLRALLRDRPDLSRTGFLVQAKVPGEGRGVFLLAKDGRVTCSFAHRRIREKPPWGGVSTLCEAAAPEPELLGHASRLLGALKWSGVAMVEFKWDPLSKRAWLMEINGRLWGSLQLAVAAGADFPWFLYQQEALGQDVSAPSPRGGVRLCWLLGDLDHFLIRLKRGGSREVRPVLRDLGRTREGRSLDLDTLKADDPLPFIAECAQRMGISGQGR